MSARRDALNRASRAGGRRWKDHTPAWLWAGGGLIAALVAYVAFAVFFAGPEEVLRYETGLGQHQTVTLPDGSRAILDAATQLDVRYVRRARAVRLLHGQARFEVAHNPSRPFTVRAGNQTVLAVGTDFNVDVVGESVLVALIQGRITVTPSGIVGMEPITLSPGQQLIASPSQPPRIHPVSIHSVTAWQAGQLVFNDASLGSVVATITRYTEHPVMADRDIAGLHISGVFKEGDIATFVDVITHYLPVRATRLPNGSIMLHSSR